MAGMYGVNGRKGFRILMICPTTEPPTGISIAIGILRNELSKYGHIVTYVNTAPIKLSTAGTFSLARVKTMTSTILASIVKIRSCDKVYITLSSSRLGIAWNMPIIWGAWLQRTPIVGHLHGGGFLEFFLGLSALEKFLVRATINRLSKIIVLGESLRSQFPFVAPTDSRIEVVPNTCETAPTQFVERDDISHDFKCFHLLYLSNLIESKGFLDLLEACVILKSRIGSGFSCDFCGGFVSTSSDTAKHVVSTSNEFQHLIDSRGLGDVVRYHGVVTGQVKRAFLCRSHALVLPTYYPWEGQPISIIEAFAHAMPVIATRHRGIVDQVIDGVNGVFVPPRSPSSIAAAVLTCIRDPGLYKRLSRGALETFRSNFSYQVHVARMARILGE